MYVHGSARASHMRTSVVTHPQAEKRLAAVEQEQSDATRKAQAAAAAARTAKTRVDQLDQRVNEQQA